MAHAVDISAIVVLSSLGVFLLVWTRQFQRISLRLLRTMPGWLRGPVPLAYYQSSFFLWMMRFVGIGCMVAAWRVLSWFLTPT